MKISHFLNLIGSFCSVNVFYTEESDVSMLQQTRLSVTVYKKTEAELLLFLFKYIEYYDNYLALFIDGHYKSTCAVCLLLMDANQRYTFSEQIGITYEKYEPDFTRFSILRYYMPKLRYFAVFTDSEFFLRFGPQVSEFCSNYYCHIPDNMAFFIQNYYHSRVKRVCTMRKKYLRDHKFKFETKYLQKRKLKFKKKFLRSQMECERIQNKAISLDDIFTERVYSWEVRGLIHPGSEDILETPAKALANFNLKMVLKRLTLRNLNYFLNPEFPWDQNPVRWYINLNLLALSNASGIVHDDDTEVAGRFRIVVQRMYIRRTESSYNMIITDSADLEGITCYHEPFISFHMYSSPFVINLWISIVLGVISVSLFLNVYIHFYHQDIVSSISPTLLSISLLANVSYCIPNFRSLSGIQMYSFWRVRLGY